MQVSLISCTPNAEENIAYIARVSSSRKDKRQDFQKLIKYLIKNRHWSPFEHSFMTFDIETSKAIGIQLLRHRSFTFQEFSQRYQDVQTISEDMYERFNLRKQHANNRQSSDQDIDKSQDFFYDLINDHLSNTTKLYNKMLEYGVSRETARMILPMCTKTKIRMTGSVRSWIHFLEVRTESHAQLEMQELAKEIKKLVYNELPVIANALEELK
jgi:thymidylate synthase (FAD)